MDEELPEYTHPEPGSAEWWKENLRTNMCIAFEYLNGNLTSPRYRYKGRDEAKARAVYAECTNSPNPVTLDSVELCQLEANPIMQNLQQKCKELLTDPSKIGNLRHTD